MRVIAMLLLVAAVAACRSRVETNPSGGSMDVDVSNSANVEEWGGPLRGQASWSNITGRSTGREAGGTLSVNVTLEGLPSGGTHPWHVHEGKCGDNGPIVGPPTAYPALRGGSDGRATAAASISVNLNEARDYYVNVHLSPSQLGTIIACGDFDD